MDGNKRVNSYAVVSLILGIVGVLLNIFLIGLFAIYAGEKFRRLNKKAEGVLRGKVLALIGTFLGIIPFLIMAIKAVIENLLPLIK